MNDHLTTKTLSLLLALILAAGGMTACQKGGGAPETVPAETEAAEPAEVTETAPETVPPAEAAPTSPYPKLTDFSWTMANADAVGSLTFEGGNACLNLIAGGVTKTLSGPAEVAEKTLTVDGEKIGWAVVATFCRLTVDGVGYSFRKADSPEAARGPYELLTEVWEGDGASLSFSGKTASLTIDGAGTWVGTWELSAGRSLLIHDDAKGDPGVNLALGAKVTASSQETADFPGPLAADGSLETRWSSEYKDPSWLLLDLGSEKEVGAAVLYFETAASADFTLETSSDGKSFKEAASVKGNKAAGIDNPVTVLFQNPAKCRYVRFNGLSRATDWGHSIYELELYAYIPGEAECGLAFEGDHVKLTMNGKTYTMTKKG